MSVATDFGSRRQGRGNLPDRRVNLYDVLQVSVNAGPEVIRAAYRALAREYHPDVNPSPETAQQMCQLNAAYSVLSDPVRRARYDAFLGRWAQTRAASAGGPANPRTVRRRSSARMRSYTAPGQVLPMPRTSGSLLVRVLIVLAIVLLVIGAFGFSLWLMAGLLEDEPLRAMMPSALAVRHSFS